MYFFTLPFVLYRDGMVQRMLSAPIFRRIATLGYGVYLVHIPIIDHVMVPIARKLQSAKVSMILVWPSALALDLLISFAVAYLLHVLVEKPSLRIRERLAS
jgi:peptidoglycan/LPS O-acetylase OafA/YrhL